ncbi:MAG: DPP IV N-terminal domain-containing protein [Pseudomonadota bacterium]
MPLLAIVTATAPKAAELPPLTLDRLFASPSLFGTAPSQPTWSADSSYLAFSWNDAGQKHRGLWLVANDGEGLRQLDGGPDASPSVREIAWLPDGDKIVSLRGNSLWTTSAASGREKALVDIGEGAYDLKIAPGGSRATFLQGGDLWLVDLDKRSVTRVTNVGIPALSSLAIGRYNRPEREIGPGIWGGPTYAWSPDGRYLAVHHVDRRQMRRVPFPDYLAAETDTNEVRRGYPGDPNELRTVGLLDLTEGSLQLLELKDPAANQVVGFSWSPEGVLLVDTASDTAVDRWLYTVQPGENQAREILHERRESRIYTSFASGWHPDGKRVVFLSDRGDRYGLYSLDPGMLDAEPERLTDPAYDVLGAPVVAGDAIFYAANGGSPYERHSYRIDASGDPASRLTRQSGHNSAYPAPDGRHVAILRSDDQTPTELYVMTGDGGGAVRVTHSPPDEFAEREWGRVRYASFPSRVDDYTLHARILEPATLDRGRKYPVIFGPMYSNTVRNRWRGSI